MATPALYDRIAARLACHRKKLLLAAFVLLIAPLMASAVAQWLAPSGSWNTSLVLYAVAPILIWCWGLVMVVEWFGPSGLTRRGGAWLDLLSWVASTFLTVWFVAALSIYFVLL